MRQSMARGSTVVRFGKSLPQNDLASSKTSRHKLESAHEIAFIRVLKSCTYISGLGTSPSKSFIRFAKLSLNPKLLVPTKHLRTSF